MSKDKLAPASDLRDVRGMSLKKLNYAVFAVSLVISIILLASTFLTSIRYSDVRDSTDNFLDWQQKAGNLQVASDFLTEQVREFAVTGEREYLDAYFEEAKVTRRRDKTLEMLNEHLAGTPAYSHLQRAMEKSVALMDREYYSMRLVVESRGYDISEYPEEVRNVVLSDEDAALSPEDQLILAERMVFDSVYHDYKSVISGETQKALDALSDDVEKNMDDSSEKLAVLLLVQQLLIVCLVAVVLIVIVLTFVQVIKPLVHAIPKIENEESLPMKGAYEYRYLAKTYNRIFSDNRRQKKLLAYEATHDPLTKALNRNGFGKICEDLDFTGSAVLIIDIDGFKSINDTRGHDIGDKALLAVVKEINKTFRSNDILCRLGGDEFTVIMSGVSDNPGDRDVISGKIARINHALLDPDDPDLPVLSVSCGVAFGKPGAGVEALLKLADVALYEVKNSDKSGVAFSDGVDMEM